MLHDTDWLRITDYVTGRATLVERAELEAWVRESPERQELIDGVQRVWGRAGEASDSMGPVDVRRAWSAVLPKLDERTVVLPLRSSGGRRYAGVNAPSSRRRTILLRAAAVLLAVGSVGSALTLTLSGRTRSASESARASMREVATSRGQRATLRLDDGTRVVLGPESRLRWGDLTHAAHRDVIIDGEAMFTVVHDARRPFRVHAGNGVAEDLGTEFSVHSYPDDGRVLVVVKSGQVALKPAADSSAPRVILVSGDLGALSAYGTASIQHNVDIDRYQAFIDGRLVFVDTPLAEAIKGIQRWHNVQIIVPDSALLRATVTASFRDEGLGEVVRALAASLDVRAERRGDTVWLRAR